MSFLEEKIRYQSEQIKELRKENKRLRRKANAFDAARLQLREHGESWRAGGMHTHVSILCINLADEMDAIAKDDEE